MQDLVSVGNQLTFSVSQHTINRYGFIENFPFFCTSTCHYYETIEGYPLVL